MLLYEQCNWTEFKTIEPIQEFNVRTARYISLSHSNKRYPKIIQKSQGKDIQERKSPIKSRNSRFIEGCERQNCESTNA